MAITRKTWWAASREVTPGTPVLTPTMYLPKKGLIKKDRKPEYSTEERGSRDTNFAVQYTTRHASADFKGQFYIDTTPYLILGAMGSETISQPDSVHVPTAYKHTFNLTDALPSYTLLKSYDSQVYQMPLSYVEKFDLKITAEGKTIEFDASMVGQYPAKYTGATLTPTFSAVKAFAGYAPIITLGGSITGDINELTFSYSQKLTPWFAISGSPDMTAYYAGERTAHLDFTARFDTTTIMDRFDAGSDDTFLLDVVGATIGTYLTNTYSQELNLACAVINYDSSEWDLGKDNVLVKCKATVRPSAGAPLFTMFAQNTIPSYAL